MENIPPLVTLLLSLLFYFIGAILFVVVAVGLMLKGPARWVKITTLVLVLTFVAGFCLQTRSLKGVYMLAFIFLFALAGMTIAVLAWRHPYRKEYAQATGEDCPAYARKKIGAWSAELEKLGFRLYGHRLSKWKFGRKERTTFTSFFEGESDPAWFELHALSSPKVCARMVVTDIGENRSVQTVDQQSDVEVIGDKGTIVDRVKRSSTCEEMLRSHRGVSTKAGGTAREVEEIDKASADLFNGMFERLVKEGRLVRRGEAWVAIPPRRIPASILKALSAWFQ